MQVNENKYIFLKLDGWLGGVWLRFCLVFINNFFCDLDLGGIGGVFVGRLRLFMLKKLG